MSLSQALSIAMSGLRANQLALSLTSSNVANSDTPGYIRKTVNQIQTSSGSIGAGVSVTGANTAMQQIVNLNTQLASGDTTDAAAAALKDQRDQYVDQLSKLMDIRVIDNGNNQIQVFTNSGVQLVGAEASTLSFNPQGTV